MIPLNPKHVLLNNELFMRMPKVHFYAILVIVEFFCCLFFLPMHIFTQQNWLPSCRTGWPFPFPCLNFITHTIHITYNVWSWGGTHLSWVADIIWVHTYVWKLFLLFYPAYCFLTGQGKSFDALWRAWAGLQWPPPPPILAPATSSSSSRVAQ